MTTVTPGAVEVTQADREAWEQFGPAIFYGDMTGPEALARHRIAATPPDALQTVVEADLDWRLIAKIAGENGIRYRTNAALVKFLNALSLAGGDV